jgi:NEDD4-binding protein 2
MKTFSLWIENKKEKKLIIMRGISGSGKSTLAKKMGIGGVVLSTDDYFMKDGVYDFDPTKLGIYHKMNQEKAKEHMEEGISPIVIDNTNSQEWEMKPYVALADQYGYDVQIEELPTPDIEELLKRQKNRESINKSLPKETLERMINKFKKGVTVDDIRSS